MSSTYILVQTTAWDDALVHDSRLMPLYTTKEVWWISEIAKAIYVQNFESHTYNETNGFIWVH